MYVPNSASSGVVSFNKRNNRIIPLVDDYNTFFYTKDEINSLLTTQTIDLSEYAKTSTTFTKLEMISRESVLQNYCTGYTDTELNSYPTLNFLTTNYYTKTTVDGMIDIAVTNLNSLLTNSYYNKTSIDSTLTYYYTKNETNSQLTNSLTSYYDKTSINSKLVGYCPLDNANKIALSYLPPQSMLFRGMYSANFNVPHLDVSGNVDGVMCSHADYFMCSSSGSIFGLTLQTGDWIIWNNYKLEWELSKANEDVVSFNSRLGAIVPIATDYSSFYYLKSETDSAILLDISAYEMTVNSTFLKTLDASNTYFKITGMSDYYNKTQTDYYYCTVNTFNSTITNYWTGNYCDSTYATKNAVTNLNIYLGLGLTPSGYVYVGGHLADSYYNKGECDSYYITYAGTGGFSTGITGTLAYSSAVTNTLLNLNSKNIVNKDYCDTYYQSLSGMSSYLLKTDASSSYLKILDASSSYLKILDASSSYLKILDASSSYLKILDASGTYQKITSMSTYSNTITMNSAISTAISPCLLKSGGTLTGALYPDGGIYTSVGAFFAGTVLSVNYSSTTPWITQSQIANDIATTNLKGLVLTGNNSSGSKMVIIQDNLNIPNGSITMTGNISLSGGVYTPTSSWIANVNINGMYNASVPNGQSQIANDIITTNSMMLCGPVNGANKRNVNLYDNVNLLNGSLTVASGFYIQAPYAVCDGYSSVAMRIYGRKNIVAGLAYYLYSFNSGTTTIPVNSATFDTLMIASTGAVYGTSTQVNISGWSTANYMTIEWLGYVLVDTDDTYNFATSSSDGSEIIIDGFTVSAHYGTFSVFSSTAPDPGCTTKAIYLKAGLHRFYCRCYKTTGTSSCYAFYKTSAGSYTLIPTSKFCRHAILDV